MPDTTTDRHAVDLKKGVIYTLVNNSWVPRKMTAAEVQKYSPPKQGGGKSGNVGAPTEESDLKKAGRGGALGVAAGLGIPETQTPITDLAKSMTPEHPILEAVDPTSGVKKILGIAKNLLGTGNEVAKDVVPPSRVVPFNSLGIAGGTQPGKGMTTPPPPLDVEKTSHDVASLLTQLAMLKGGKKAAETPLAESEVVRAAKEVPNIPPRVAQNVTGAKYATNKLEKAAGEKTAAYEKAKADRAADIEEQQAAKEARDAKELAENKTKNQESLVKARAEHEAETLKHKESVRKQAKKYAEDLAEKKKAEADNAQLEAKRKGLEQNAEQGAKRVTENVRQVIDNAKKKFDEEYGDFDRKILGKDEYNPKGTAQSDLSSFANAVKDAKENLIEGSPEKIKQFESIIDLASKGKSEIENVKGQLLVTPGKTLPTVDLRGFITELDSALYNRELLPDVRNAVKEVVRVGKEEVFKSVKAIGGDTAVSALEDLNSRYSDYLTDWRDTSSTNPLPKVRRILLEGVAKNNPAYPVHIDVGRILKGGNAQKAAVLLDKYRTFGASPEILSDYTKTLDQLDALEKMKKVPGVKKPEYREPARIPRGGFGQKVDLSEPPKPEPFKPRGRDPEAPEPFDRQNAMRDELERRLNAAGHVGSVFPIIRAISDALHGNFGGAATAAEQAAAIQAIKALLTSDKSLNYLSRDVR